jgi:hypothetical protein
MLRYTVVGSVDLAKMNAIPRIDEGLKQLKNPHSILGSQKAFNILEHECPWPLPSYHAGICRH